MKYTSLALLGILLTGCNGFESDTEIEVAKGSDVTFTVQEFIMADGSRSAIDGNGQFAWTEGDTLGIFPEEGYQTAFPVSEGTGTATALFDGGQWALRKNARYAAYFPFMHPMDQIQKDAIPVSYEGQCQNGNSSTAHLGRYDYVAAPYTDVNEYGSTTFQLQHLGALVRFTLTMPQADSYRKLVVSTSDVQFTTQGTYRLDAPAENLTPETSAYTMEMDLQNVASTASASSIVLYMMMAPTDLRSTTVSVYVFGSTEMYKATVNGKNMLAGRAYAYSAVCEAENNGNSHDYVDLGLPSGTLWATCNIGAESPEEYGDYFAWGETSPQAGNQYSWESYKWCNGTYKTLTRYCTDSSYGTVDGKTELDPADDAAYVSWGPAWRTPTQAQIQELYNSSNTTTTGWEQNGVYGRKITSKRNGKSIFLPAAGYRYDSKLRETDNYGYYWSATIHTTYSYYADYLYFYTSGIDWGYHNRSNGRSVRPVRAK